MDAAATSSHQEYGFRRILVPTDFSDNATHAFVVALDLARTFDAEVHLLHITSIVEQDAYSPLHYSPEASALQERAGQAVRDLLREAVEEANADGVRVEAVQKRGMIAPAAGIVEYARRNAVDLIAMGTHGRRGIRRFILGSVTERVLQQAPCHVLTVREHEGAELRAGYIQRILGPTDLSEDAALALPLARELAARYKARLDLLHVIEPLPFPTSITTTVTVYDLVPDIEEKARRQLEELTARSGESEVASTVYVEEGHPVSTVVDFAKQHKSDLIVIASHGLSGLERFLIGSVTRRIVRLAPCPVLTVNTREPRPEGEAA